MQNNQVRLIRVPCTLVLWTYCMHCVVCMCSFIAWYGCTCATICIIWHVVWRVACWCMYVYGMLYMKSYVCVWHVVCMTLFNALCVLCLTCCVYGIQVMSILHIVCVSLCVSVCVWLNVYLYHILNEFYRSFNKYRHVFPEHNKVLFKHGKVLSGAMLCMIWMLFVCEYDMLCLCNMLCVEHAVCVLAMSHVVYHMLRVCMHVHCIVCLCIYICL